MISQITGPRPAGGESWASIEGGSDFKVVVDPETAAPDGGQDAFASCAWISSVAVRRAAWVPFWLKSKPG